MNHKKNHLLFAIWYLRKAIATAGVSLNNITTPFIIEQTQTPSVNFYSSGNACHSSFYLNCFMGCSFQHSRFVC